MAEKNAFKSFIRATLAQKENQERQWEQIKEVFKKWKSSAPRPNEKVEPTEIGIQRQLKISDKSLSELLRDGSETISNIRIANDKREVERRKDETDIRDILLASLRTESIEANKKFEEINLRWIQMDPVKDPMTLFEGLEQQKRRISNLMKQKDVVIEELHLALDRSDERYYLDQDKQIVDIYCLVERIDSQVDVMKRAFREHLEILQNTIDEEKRNFMAENSSTWNQLYDKRAEEEEGKIVNDRNRIDAHDEEIKRIILEHKELIRSTRIRLDLDNDTLQIELENVKAEVLLNSEKLAYNYKVLQKRADENVIIRNQQKRRLGKLQEIITEMKEKTRKVKHKYSVELTKLNTEVKKLNRNVSELKTKINLFAQVNDQKYHTVWSINEEEIMNLMEQIFNIDRNIYEKELRIEWIAPANVVPKKTELTSFKKAVERLNERDARNVRTIESYRINEELSETDLMAIRSILNKIAQQTRWMVDDKLDDLLQPYENYEKTLVKVENVFSVLNIASIEEICLLKEHFLEYAWCPNCKNSTSDNNSTLCPNHFCVIESHVVLPALRKFVEDREKMIYQSNALDSQSKISNVTISRLLQEVDVAQFWKDFRYIVPLYKYQLWNAVESGLNSYINVLKRRESLDQECDVLRKQNAELNHLLQRCIPTTNNFG